MSNDKKCCFKPKQFKKFGDGNWVYCEIKKEKIRVVNGKCKSHTCSPLNKR